MEEQKKEVQPSGPENKERRTAMKKIAVGVGALATIGALPEKWTQPIVSQIVLPAHAGTSGSSLNDPCSVELLSGTQADSSVTIQVSGFVTPPSGGLTVIIVATPQPIGDAFKETATASTANDGTFLANITVYGGPGITSVSVSTSVAGAEGTATCSLNIPGGSTTTPPPAE